jgi:MinD-like ATPase involved in chromosome partitioning or flagellar assembly
MSNIIAFVSVKGGVGKTTLALEVASSLVNHFNKKVLLVDANFSAPNIGLYFGLTNDLSLHDALDGTPLHNTIYEAHGIDIIPASMKYHSEVDPFKLKKLLAKFKPRYDYIIIDSSPNYEELKPVINTADRIFLVTSPDHVTLETSLKAAELAKSQDTPIEGIVVNKIRSPKHEYNLQQIENQSETPVIARIKDHKEIAAALFQRTPITISSPNNTISKEIRRLASALSGEPEIQNKFFKKLFANNLIGKEKVNRDLLRQKFYESQFT